MDQNPQTWIELVKYAGLATLPLTLYFAWMKMGYRVGATYTWGHTRLSAAGIQTITLMNLKDRPVAIFEAHAVMGGKSISLKKFDPPFILKGMESANIQIEPVSKYTLGNDDFEWKLPVGEGDAQIDIYLSTVGKNIRCLKRGPSSHFNVIRKKNLRMICNHTRSYNGHIINDDALYAVIYHDDGKDKTVFIDRHGHMNNWDYLPNALSQSALKDVESVRSAITGSKIGTIMQSFVVVDLSKE